MSKLKMMMSVMSNVKPILKLIANHSGYYKEHSKSEIRELEKDGKKYFMVIEKTSFQSNQDAEIYTQIITRINSKMSKIITPPMRIFLGLFQYLKLIISLVEEHGNIKQQIAEPQIVQKDNLHIVIEKTIFESREDAEFWLNIIPNMNKIKV